MASSPSQSGRSPRGRPQPA